MGNPFFPIREGSARIVSHDAKGIPGGPAQFGNTYIVYNPLEKQNFSVKHAFADAYGRVDHPATGGKPMHEVLGPPVQNDGGDGQGKAFQHFHRGFMTWSQAEGMQLHLDFPIGEGWARKIPSSWKCIPGDGAAWGDVFWVFNPENNKRSTVKHGFAMAYESRDYPESGGRPLYEVLGPPKDKENGDGADGAIQEFKNGTLTWNPRDGVRVKLKAGEPAAAGEKKPMRQLSMQEIAALSGREPAKKKTPRLRIAPSPTGYLHIGNAWIAVINYLMAKKLGGEFMLRIEDTDPLRSKPEYTEVIKQSLEWLGVKWSGEVVFQSQRTQLYQQKVRQLIDEGKAYKDPKTGMVYFRMPDQGPLVFHDRVRGRVEVPPADEHGNKDIPLLRADGSPMFLLANTIDDGEQGITHVVRGEGHLENAARQQLLFRALGYEVPEFYHLPHIVDEDGSKLSKRAGATSVMDFKQRGIDAEVLVNHLAGLGMRSGSDQIRSMDELIAGFDRLGFAKTASRIGLDRLHEKSKKRMAQLETSELRKKLEGFDPVFMASLGKIGAHALAEAVKNRASSYEEAIRIGKFVLAEPQYAERAARVNLGAENRALLEEARARLEGLGAWNLGGIRATLEKLNQDRGVKFRAYAEALQWTLTGDTEGIPIEHTLALLGKEKALARLDAVLSGRALLVAVPEAPAKVDRAAAEAPVQEARAAVPGLVNGKLAAYLKYAAALGAPIAEAQQGADGWWVQSFERGVAGDHGHLQLAGRPFWLTGGKLDTYLKYRELVGDATGEAYQDPPNSQQWVQKFDRALIAENGQIRFDEFPYWMTGGKLDAWMKCREQLGAPEGEAFCGTFGVWMQNFAGGQTDDSGAVRFHGAAFWIGGPVLDTYLLHREALGKPISEVYLGAGGRWIQDFERGRIDSRGQVRMGKPAQDPALEAERARVVEGALVQEDGQAAVYHVRGGAKLHIPNPEVFARMKYDGNAIVRVAPGTLRTISTVPAEGTLVREDNRPEVYVMKDGFKRHIPNEQVFAQMGFDWAQVLVVPDLSVQSVPSAAL